MHRVEQERKDLATLWDAGGDRRPDAIGTPAAFLTVRPLADVPVAWTVLVHVVAEEGYTVEEQVWGETTWDAPEDSGEDWALLWQCNDYRWLPQTTFDGLMTTADWSFALVTLDSSRERWAYGTSIATGEMVVNPVVTFGGDTIYFETFNTADVGLHQTGPSAAQPRIAVVPGGSNITTWPTPQFILLAKADAFVRRDRESTPSPPPQQ